MAPGVPGKPVVDPRRGGLEVTVVPPTTGGVPDSYTATARPGGRTCTVVGATGSCTVNGLSSTETYTITVVANNDAGASPPSEASNRLSPLEGSPWPVHLGISGLNVIRTIAIGLGLMVVGNVLVTVQGRRRAAVRTR
jgi:hypothetical protein